MKPLRVALVTTDGREMSRQYGETSPIFGTAPQALLQGFARLPEVEVHVISCLQIAVQSPEKLADNIWFHPLHVTKIGWLRTGYQGCIRAVRKRLRLIKPDIVHGQGTERDCAVSAVWSGFHNVLTIHGVMAEMARMFNARPGSFAWCAAILENLALKRTRGVLCNSAFTENLVRPRTARTWRVPNAVREPFFNAPLAHKQVEMKAPVLLNVGVICPNKRQMELLDMAGRLHKKGHRFLFHFLGLAHHSDPYAVEFLARLAARRKDCYASHDDVKTDVTSVIQCFDQASAMVHFPQVESFGLVVAEALARGLKLFSSRCGGIVDIAEGVDGVELFDPDNIAGLETAVSEWLKRGEPLSSNGHPSIRGRYHPQVIAKRHLEIYREVLSSVS
jgi:glycosyltransferase involved in cell wall biosynthesis